MNSNLRTVHEIRARNSGAGEETIRDPSTMRQRDPMWADQEIERRTETQAINQTKTKRGNRHTIVNRIHQSRCPSIWESETDSEILLIVI
jgi:hypothetical protein